MKTHKFMRKPFYIDAVRVSELNIKDVAEWCGGEIQTTDEGTFIEVKVYRPLTPRQSQAFIGDWVLSSGNGFKIYTPKAFDKSFEKVKTLTKAQADEAGIKVPHEKRQKKGAKINFNSKPEIVKEEPKAQPPKPPAPSPMVMNMTKRPVPSKSPEDVAAEQLINEVLKHS